jgi:cytoskeletal protein CcmA (bactofilin family)
MKKVVILSLISILIFPAMIFAADFKANESGNVNIESSEKTKNLYTAGNSISSDADITGDLVVAGNNININGDVENSLAAAGNTINIKGNIGRNARIAGSTISINGNVGEDLLIAGGSIIIGKDAVIKNDLLVSCGTIEINGKVLGNIKAAGAEKLIIRGEVLGNIDAKEIQNLTIESSAVVNGKLTYSSAKEANIADKNQIKGGIDYKKIANTENLGNNFGNTLIKILVGFITLFVLIYLAPKFTQNLVEDAYNNPWGNIGTGLIFLIVAPIVGLILAFSVLGIKIALILALIYVLYLVLAGLSTSILAGSLILKFIDRSKVLSTSWRAIAVGVIVISLISLLPIFGWFIIFIFFLLGLGELIQRSLATLKKQRS